MTRTLDGKRTNFLAGLAGTVLAGTAAAGLKAEETGHDQFGSRFDRVNGSP
jgi:hypothetical protein